MTGSACFKHFSSHTSCKTNLYSEIHQISPDLKYMFHCNHSYYYADSEVQKPTDTCILRCDQSSQRTSQETELYLNGLFIFSNLFFLQYNFIEHTHLQLTVTKDNLQQNKNYNYNLKLTKKNPAHLRIPVSCNVRHKQ